MIKSEPLTAEQYAGIIRRLAHLDPEMVHDVNFRNSIVDNNYTLTIEITEQEKV